MPGEKDAVEAMKTVMDPELGIDIHTMGLIYDKRIKGDKIKIIMTYTSPMCPYGPHMEADLTNKLKEKGFKVVEIEITFDPPWEPSEELREMLGV